MPLPKDNNYEFKVFESMKDMHDEIKAKKIQSTV